MSCLRFPSLSTAVEALTGAMAGVALTLAAQPAAALTIVMPNSDWITHYDVGLCALVYGSDNVIDWTQLTQAANGSYQLGPNEPVCVLGHGDPGSIGGIDAATIAAQLSAKVVATAGQANPVYLNACNSATVPNQGSSVLEAVVGMGGSFAGQTAVGALGICVANRESGNPLLSTILQEPLPAQGICSYASLEAEQDNLVAQVQASIDACEALPTTLAKGVCLADVNQAQGAAILAGFYTPFLAYIAQNGCSQNPGVASQVIP